MSENIVDCLVGCEMSSVEFVRDYCQLRFDGPTLTAFVMPVITVGNEQLHPATPSYRDALCSLIGLEVCRTEILKGDAIRLHFVNGLVVSVSINDEEYVECAMFNDQNGLWDVWRPQISLLNKRAEVFKNEPTWSHNRGGKLGEYYTNGLLKQSHSNVVVAYIVDLLHINVGGPSHVL